MSNDIRKLLDIQDGNITFPEGCVEDRIYKGISCKFIHGHLTYTPTECSNCKAEKQGASIIKNGTQTSRITLPISGTRPTYLYLKKQRFVCKACHSSFTAKSPVVKKHCFISRQVKSQVAMKSSDAISIKAIARDCHVSQPTVQRIIDQSSAELMSLHRSLPEHLSFDEFKIAKGQMAFHYIDVEEGKILDILEGRTNRIIFDHFIPRYSLKQRQKVKTITIDMNAGYVSVIKELFPNAEIIIDRFHLFQLITRALNQTRIMIMNRYNTYHSLDGKIYRRLKRYWKILLKKESSLSRTEYKDFYLFGLRTEFGVVEEILSYDEELANNYRFYQKLLHALDTRDFDALEALVNEQQPELISTYLKTSIKTLKQHLPYIKNSFIFPYSNGKIEGIHNKIKVLSRIAYGYSNFHNFRKRIFVHFYLKPIKTQSTEKTRTKAA